MSCGTAKTRRTTQPATRHSFLLPGPYRKTGDRSDSRGTHGTHVPSSTGEVLASRPETPGSTTHAHSANGSEPQLDLALGNADSQRTLRRCSQRLIRYCAPLT